MCHLLQVTSEPESNDTCSPDAPVNADEAALPAEVGERHLQELPHAHGKVELRSCIQEQVSALEQQAQERA